jgi:predicted nucleic acid-binding protein
MRLHNGAFATPLCRLIRATFQKRSPVSLRIYQAIKEQVCLLALSAAILAEIREVISRDYIVALTHTTPAQRTRYLNDLRDISMLTKGKANVTQKSRDRKDLKNPPPEEVDLV